MNKQLIRKYRDVFDYWINEGEFYVLIANMWHHSTEFSIGDDRDWRKWDIDTIYVIDDKYSQFRKALAEGKTIESQVAHSSSGCSYPSPCEELNECRWSVDTCSTFHGESRLYRIKPDEPTFRVGDWIRSGDRVFQYTDSDLNYDRANPTHGKNDKLWEPEENEVCLFWDNGSDYSSLQKFKEKYNSRMISTSYEEWDNCMPFTGVLPPNMKE